MLSGRPAAVASGVVVLVFGVVWALSAWDLTVLESLIAAVGVAGVVSGSIYLLRPSSELAERGNRLLELMQPSRQARRGIRDETTGLLNRWYLEGRLEEEAARCQRYQHSMTVVVLKANAMNLAHFSVDSWQRQSMEAAQRCAAVIRNVDLSAALAPFEFAMCLVQCDRRGADVAIERILSEFVQYDCRVGMSVYPDDGCEPQEMIELAREASPMLKAA